MLRRLFALATALVPRRSRPRWVARNIIVSLDFDGVLALAHDAKIKYAKEWFGLTLHYGRTKKDDFDRAAHKAGLHLDYRTDFCDRLNAEHLMEYTIPPYCRATLRTLHAHGFRFVVITSRNDWELKQAKRFIKRHFAGLINYVHHTSNEPKAYFVKKLHPRIHLDDDLYKLEELSECPVEPYWFRQPENAHHTNRNRRIKSVPDWQDFRRRCFRLQQLHEAICWRHGIKNSWHNLKHIYERLHQLSEREREQLLAEYARSA